MPPRRQDRSAWSRMSLHSTEHRPENHQWTVLHSQHGVWIVYEFVLLIHTWTPHTDQSTDRIFRLAPDPPPEAADPVPRVFPGCPRSKASHKTSTSIGECRPKGMHGAATGSSGRPRGRLSIKKTASHLPPAPPRCTTTLDERLPAANRRRTNPHPSRRSWFDAGDPHGRGIHTGNPWRGRGSNPTPLLRGGSRLGASGPPQQGWRNCSSSSTTVPRMRIEDGTTKR